MTTTLFQYLSIKLTDAKKKIQSATNDILRAANDLDINLIQSSTIKLDACTENWRSLCKDAVKYLTVDEFVLLHQSSLIDDYTAQYSFKYDREVTIEERNKLSKLHYGYENCKVK